MIKLHKRSKTYARIFDQQIGLYEGYARKHGLHAKCLSILMWIYYNPEGVTQNWVSKKTYSSKQVVNATIKKFQERGWVFLEENPADKRHKRVKLTEEGRMFANQILHPLEEAEQQALSKLSQKEQELLLQLTQCYSQNLAQILLGGEND
ncbi:MULTISPECIES: MarR family winged helix-turn-helix transcriptional regulator [Streptococcus]|uniref:MarR family transcriptional regulator n=1 Tax=Streptococcus ruminantium TaxID=1917441 RepID=A0A2Z5TXL8_9STRE|nr:MULTISPECIES: MarR family winged helix-turn-helix transcriptional regulator [Streptococcus]MDQ8760139.1 MarR family winged helix-turn-helix transcriptional regulator [Streptococcus ruminantium]MDQ8765469.1 MarR family winged helix-turn-helix transcriptional regulator [Streptococcus ruminantium]MDQ8767707.1 MarR family winged helix-turn-helix transcriptional regulator [Streptococcus ruminantium]MDQ8769461.1 MarR family winged helix-turn-helix transcriptional regulator [Streptococcus ruminanti